MNYLLAFALCLGLTYLSWGGATRRDKTTLIITDMQVALFLLAAWVLQLIGVGGG